MNLLAFFTIYLPKMGHYASLLRTHEDSYVELKVM